MKFTMTISDVCLNTILTALNFEKARAEEENNEKVLVYINDALSEINENTYVANVRDV